MGRRKKLKEINHAERVMALHRVRCQSLAVRPRYFFHRHQLPLILGGGVTLGLIAGHPAGRKVVSLLASLTIGIVRFQPRLLTYFLQEREPAQDSEVVG